MAHIHLYNSDDANNMFSGQNHSGSHHGSLGLYDMGNQGTLNGTMRAPGLTSSEMSVHAREMYSNQSRQDNLAIIGAASKDTLFYSQNPVYLALFQENMRLRAELDAKGDLVAHLKERDRVSTPLAFSAASVPLTAPSEFQLVTPAPPFPCNQEDYADVRFWTRAEWTEYERKENAKGVRPNKLSFITQEDGSFIPRDRLSAMTREAQKLWGSLYRTRDDPHSWGNKTKTASDYFSNSMCLKFEEFRWCADDWKIEAFATIKFPDWARYSRSSGTLPRAMPSINNNLKRKMKNDDQDIKTSKPSARPLKRIKQEPHPSIDTDIIDLLSDSNSNSESSPKPSTSTKLGSTTTPLLKTTRNPPLRSPSKEISASTARKETPITSSPANGPAGSPTAIIKEHEQGGNGSKENLPPPRGSGGRRSVNLLLNLTIPKPSNDMLAPVVDTPAAPLPSETSKTNRVKKGAKLMEASNSYSARNLFAIEYLKTHSVTVSEFKVVYDALDRDTLKIYEALSRDKKKEANSVASGSK